MSIKPTPQQRALATKIASHAGDIVSIALTRTASFPPDLRALVIREAAHQMLDFAAKPESS